LLQDTSLNDNKYISYTIAPDTGYTLNLDNASFAIRSNPNILDAEIRSSLDGFTASLGSGDDFSSNGSFSADFSGSEFNTVTSTLEFRIYLWGYFGSGRVGGVTDNGDISTGVFGTAIPIPEPSTTTALLGGVALLIALRRRRKQ